MKIIALNTWAGIVFDPLMEFLEAHADKTDLFCFQEVFYRAEREGEHLPVYKEGDEKKHKDLFHEIQNRLPNHVGYYAPSQDDFEGLAMFSRKGMVTHRQGDTFVLKHRNVMPPAGNGTEVGRNVQFVECDVDGRRVTIMNFHGW